MWKHSLLSLGAFPICWVLINGTCFFSVLSRTELSDVLTEFLDVGPSSTISVPKPVVKRPADLCQFYEQVMLSPLKENDWDGSVFLFGWTLICAYLHSMAFLKLACACTTLVGFYAMQHDAVYYLLVCAFYSRHCFDRNFFFTVPSNIYRLLHEIRCVYWRDLHTSLQTTCVFAKSNLRTTVCCSLLALEKATVSPKVC